MKTIDLEYQSPKRFVSEYPHQYGENVHILADPVLIHLTTLLSSEHTKPEQLPNLIRNITRILLYNSLTLIAPVQLSEVRSHMAKTTPQGVFSCVTLDTTQSYVVVSLARAGIVPAQLCYEELQSLVGSSHVRQDHFLCERSVDKQGHVYGTAITGSKIGGPIDNSILIIPDPMGATGNTLCTILDHYQQLFPNRPPKKVVALHAIVAPEYLHKIANHHAEVEVVTARLDRGLSPTDVLKTSFGHHWSQEKGLNEHHYIVPGAGGVGELLNNTSK